jgi:HlyD family secretion protein
VAVGTNNLLLAVSPNKRSTSKKEIKPSQMRTTDQMNIPKPMQSKHLPSKLTMLAVAIIGSFIISACGQKPATESKANDTNAKPATEQKADGKADSKVAASAAKPKPALTVAIEQPRQATINDAVSFNGNVAAWQEASVSAEANGLRIADVMANVGDVVRKGQLLVRLNESSVQTELAAQRAAVADAQAQLADAKANADRARQLDKTGAISVSQIEQFFTMEKTAKARLDAAIARQRSDEIRLNNARIVAPDDGIISVKTATVGSVVQAGQELFRIIRKGRLEFRADVPAGELGKIKNKQTVVVHAGEGLKANGTVRLVSPTVDPQTRNAIVYVDLPVGSAIKAGMYAKGNFDLGSSSATTVLAAAVVRRDGFDYIYLVEADGRVKQMKVQIGVRQGDRIEVKGLASNARVVTTGASFLNDGDLVRIEAITPSAPKASLSTTTNS